MSEKQKLELMWVGKHERSKLEPRILIEDRDLSHRADNRRGENDIFDNMIIHGDNLLALKALEQQFTGRLKCIYIDPPYNTGNALNGYYDDGLEHSAWLGLIRDRIEILRNLLSDEGVIFVSIDEDEGAYLKVLMDEIFQRKNYCGSFVWEKKKKPSFLNTNMGSVTESIFAYAKDRRVSPAFIGGVTEKGKKYPVNNAGNSVQIITFPANSVTFNMQNQTVEPQDMSEGNIVTKLLEAVKIVDGRNVNAFSLEGEWRYSQRKIDEIVAAGEEIKIAKIPFRPNHIKLGGEPKKIKNLLSILNMEMATYEDATEESRALFGVKEAFPYPKPEKLIQTLLATVTEEGDMVLDSFAGSGTTAAVAHKMGRRWIVVELEDHARTHIVPRLKKVADGEDTGGITEAVDWKGGGGFRFYRLAPSLLEKDPYGNWVISKEYDANMLAAAMCKIMGFTHQPSETDYWNHGYSTESDFIFVTTRAMTHEVLAALSAQVGPERSLLICCKAFKAKSSSFENLTLKKIPQAVLDKCEWAKDDYSLKVENPEFDGEEEEDD